MIEASRGRQRRAHLVAEDEFALLPCGPGGEPLLELGATVAPERSNDARLDIDLSATPRRLRLNERETARRPLQGRPDAHSTRIEVYGAPRQAEQLS